MEQRIITKQLAGAEDLTRGIGTVQQLRGTGNKTITKMNVSELQGPLVVENEIAMAALVVDDIGDTKLVICSDSGKIFRYDVASASWTASSAPRLQESALTLGVDIGLAAGEAFPQNLTVNADAGDDFMLTVYVVSSGVERRLNITLPAGFTADMEIPVIPASTGLSVHTFTKFVHAPLSVVNGLITVSANQSCNLFNTSRVKLVRL